MNKQNKNNTPQYVLVAIALLAVSISYNYFKNVQIQERVKLTQKKTKAETPIEHEVGKKNNERKLASVPKANTSVIQKFQNRSLVGTFTKNKKLPIANKINKDWKKVAFNKLNRFTEADTKLEIQEVKPAIFVQHNIGKYVEHVKIILKKDNGHVSAYEAYIDSQSGNVIRTWNRTQAEINHHYKMSAHGKGYVGLPLEKDPVKASL